MFHSIYEGLFKSFHPESLRGSQRKLLSSFEKTGLPAYYLFRFLTPSPTLFSTPRLLILENFDSLLFYSRLPVY